MFRCFFALLPSDELKQKINHALPLIKPDCPDHCFRWYPDQNWHLTLSFIGNIAPDQVQPMWNVVREAVSDTSAFDYHLHDIALFPNNRKPKVLALLGEPNTQLAHLAETIEHTVIKHQFKTNHNFFRPHITLARIIKPFHDDPAPGKGAVITTEKASDIVLIHSETLPEGPRYTMVESHPLTNN